MPLRAWLYCVSLKLRGWVLHHFNRHLTVLSAQSLRWTSELYTQDDPAVRAPQSFHGCHARKIPQQTNKSYTFLPLILLLMCVHNDTSGRRHKDWPLRLKWPEERQSFHVELPPRSGCWSQWCGDPHGPLLVLQYRHAANCRSERQITQTLWLTGHTVNYKQPQLCFSMSDCFITANHINFVTNRTPWKQQQKLDLEQEWLFHHGKSHTFCN